MRKFLLVVITAASFACCTTTPAPTPAPAPVAAAPAPPPCTPGDATVNAVLWVQSSAEYRAVALGTYANARRMLDAALADPTWSALEQTSVSSLPPAIILDLDETATDNTPFQARVARIGKSYDAKIWDQWVQESAPRGVPGAGDFLRYAKSRGVTPFYISNRKTEEETPTRRILEKLDYPLDANLDTMLFRNERPEWSVSDKSPRRNHVAASYRVLLLLGDDLNDFAPARDKTHAEREAILDRTATLWGTKWLMIPNPMYGSWERAAAGEGSDCAQLKRKIEALQP